MQIFTPLTTKHLPMKYSMSAVDFWRQLNQIILQYVQRVQRGTKYNTSQLYVLHEKYNNLKILNSGFNFINKLQIVKQQKKPLYIKAAFYSGN
jgi:hypothetical protein